MRVPSIGPKSAKIALIGQAPGREEAEQGIPFVGNAGKELNKILAAAGISRSTLYITNVLKFYPGRDIKPYINLDLKEPQVSPEWLQAEEELYEELRGIDANVFVPLGNEALYTITRHRGILSRRGSIYSSVPELAGRKVLPTIHPAHIIRGGDSTYLLRYPMITDLMRAQEESLSPLLNLPERTFHLNPTKDEVIAYIESSAHLDRVGFDIETTVQRIKGTKCAKAMFCWSLAKSPLDALVCAMLDDDGEERFSVEDERDILEALALLLENPEVTVVGQNLGPFDSNYLWKEYGIYPWPIHDTMVALGVLFPEFPKDLGAICSTYTREPYYKDTGKFVPGNPQKWGDALRYSALDAAVVLEALPPLLRDLKRSGLLSHYEMLIRCHPALVYMEGRGIRADVEGLRKASKEAEKVIREEQRKLDITYHNKVRAWLEIQESTIDTEEGLLRDVGVLLKSHRHAKKGIKPGFWGRGLNVKSTKQKLGYFSLLGVKVPKVKGKPSTAEKAISKLAAKGIEEASFIKRITKLRDDKAKYWDCKLDSDNRLRSCYHPVGSKTRFSATKTLFGTGVSGQNQPPRMKNYMLADDGYVIGRVDLSQAENRIVAYLAGCEAQIEAFEKGWDVHAMMAGEIHKKDWREVSKEPGSSPYGPAEYSERDVGKRANHAINYDISAQGLSESMEIPLRSAKVILERGSRAFPEIKGVFHREVVAQLNQGRTLVNLLGRKRKFYGRWGAALFREAYSWIPQSTVPDLINQWGLLPIWEEDWYRVVEILNQVHDDIWFQVDGKQWKYTGLALMLASLVWALEQPLKCKGREFVIPVEVEVGLCVGKLKEVNVRQGINKLAAEIEQVVEEAQKNG